MYFEVASLHVLKGGDRQEAEVIPTFQLQIRKSTYSWFGDKWVVEIALLMSIIFLIRSISRVSDRDRGVDGWRGENL